MDIRECIKCGKSNSSNSIMCTRCTWPFDAKGWVLTKHKIERITLDTCCINAKKQNPSLNKLESWAEVNNLKLQKSDTMLKELKGQNRIPKANSMGNQPELFILGSSSFGGPNVLAGPDLREQFKKILFPTANSLTQNQLYDIEHIQSHVMTGGDVFVTLNRNDFITRGRQAKLSSLGVWVFSPNEIVSLLKKLYGWQ